MKNLLSVYRVISYIILIIAGILAFFDLFTLLAALSYPVFFIVVFVLTSVIIYTFTSFSFYNKGVQNGRLLKPSLKDWIKVNAYVTIFFCALILIDFSFFFLNPSSRADMIKMINDMRAKVPDTKTSSEAILRASINMIYIATAYSVLLLAHVIISLRLVKKYNNLFGGNGTV